jgi:hypothetical protein
MQNSTYQRALDTLSKVRLYYLGLPPYTFDGLSGEDLDEAHSEAWLVIFDELKQVLDYDRNERTPCRECRKKLLP